MPAPTTLGAGIRTGPDDARSRLRTGGRLDVEFTDVTIRDVAPVDMMTRWQAGLRGGLE